METKSKSVDDLMLEQRAATFQREEEALVAWSNTFLAQRQLSASSLADFSDGVLLINLVEVAFGARLGSYKVRPKMLAHRLDNVAMCFRYLESEGVSLLSLGPNDIVEVKTKQCINVLWNILRRLTIRGLEALRGGALGGGGGGGGGDGKDDAKQRAKETVREAIVSWVKESMPEVAVADFASSSRAGVMVCNIIERLLPGSVDLPSLTPENSLDALERALKSVEEQLRIPSLLSRADFEDPAGMDESKVEKYICMLVSAASAQQRSTAEVNTLREEAASARQAQAEKVEALRREAEEGKQKLDSMKAELDRLQGSHQDAVAGEENAKKELEALQASYRQLQAAAASLRAEAERSQQRAAEVQRSEQELMEQRDRLAAELADMQGLLKERDRELASANSETYRLHLEVENTKANARRDMTLATITENAADEAARPGGSADVANLMLRKLRETKGYGEFMSELCIKSGWLMKRRPGADGKKMFGTDKKKRFFEIKGDEVLWYKDRGEPPKGRALLRHFQKIDFQLPDNNPEALMLSNTRGSIVRKTNTLRTPDGKEEEIVLRLVPRPGVKESQAKVMELTAVASMVPELQEDVITWIETLNTRIALIDYLSDSKKGSTSLEMVEFVIDPKRTALRIESVMFDAFQVLPHFREALIMREGLSIALVNVSMQDPSVPTVADILRRNNTMRALDLSRNLLTEAGARAVADALSSNSSLESLSLEGNDVRDAGVAALAAAVATHRQLRELNFNSNRVTDAGAKALAESLVAAHKAFPASRFNGFYLARNQVGNAGAEAVAQLIRAVPGVRVVNLENNIIDDVGAAALAAALPESGVTELNLAGNQICAKGLAAISDALRRCPRQVAVDLSRNKLITSEGVRRLVEGGDMFLRFEKMAFIKMLAVDGKD